MQKIYYGAPGTGKSFEIDTFLKSEGIREEYIFRITFHPDFSYSDFIGQLLPTVIKSGPAKGDITYDSSKGSVISKVAEPNVSAVESRFIVHDVTCSKSFSSFHVTGLTL